MALREIGFFRELRHGRPDGPSITDRVGRLADPEPIARYLRSGGVIAASGGTQAEDVLDPARPAIGGLSILTDGSWVWPSDLAYFVAVHGVDPGEAFRQHVATAGPLAPELDDDALIRLSEVEPVPE